MSEGTNRKGLKMKTYPKSQSTITDEYKYCFKEYDNDGAKYFSDFYTFDGITEMASILKSKNVTFQIQEVDKNLQLHELNF